MTARSGRRDVTTDLDRVADAARAILRSHLGGDPGPAHLAASGSHHVYVSDPAVVKIIDAADHTRLDREIAIAADLPSGISAELLASGRTAVADRAVRYACFRTAAGRSPGMGLPTTDEETALALAEQAVGVLQRVHAWKPGPRADEVLREPIDHGGFRGRAALQAAVAQLGDVLPSLGPVIHRRLRRIADGAPLRAETTVPVHADCHWGNWLANGPTVTALLDLEWARYGTPLDDWFFLSRFSGPHQAAVLHRIAALTGSSLDALRAECEVREVAYLVSDLLLEQADPRSDGEPGELVDDLAAVAVHRSWWPRS